MMDFWSLPPFLFVWVKVMGRGFSGQMRVQMGGEEDPYCFLQHMVLKLRAWLKKKIALSSLILLIHVCSAQVGAELVWCPGAEGPCSRGHLV